MFILDRILKTVFPIPEVQSDLIVDPDEIQMLESLCLKFLGAKHIPFLTVYRQIKLQGCATRYEYYHFMDAGIPIIRIVKEHWPSIFLNHHYELPYEAFRYVLEQEVKPGKKTSPNTGTRKK